MNQGRTDVVLDSKFFGFRTWTRKTSDLTCDETMTSNSDMTMSGNLRQQLGKTLNTSGHSDHWSTISVRTRANEHSNTSPRKITEHRIFIIGKNQNPNIQTFENLRTSNI